jgi:transcriptional regulator with XRE-family HTH domain
MVSAFSKTLRAAMVDRNLTAKELAKRAKVAATSLSLYLSGKRLPSLEIASRIANALEVSLDKLATGSPPKSDMAADLERVFNKYEASLLRDNMSAYSLEKAIKGRFAKGRTDPGFERNVARLHKALSPDIIEDLYFLDKSKAFQLVCEKMKNNPALAAAILSSIDRFET